MELKVHKFLSVGIEMLAQMLMDYFLWCISQIDWEYEMEEVWDYSLSNFNPYRCELAPLGVRLLILPSCLMLEFVSFMTKSTLTVHYTIIFRTCSR